MKTLQPACKKQFIRPSNSNQCIFLFLHLHQSHMSHTQCTAVCCMWWVKLVFSSPVKLKTLIFFQIYIIKTDFLKLAWVIKLRLTEISVSSYFKTETYMSHGVWQVKPVFSALLRRANMLKKIIYFKGREQASLDLQAKLMISLGQ